MRSRNVGFIVPLALALLAAPLAAEAQQAGKAPRVGVLLFSNPQADPQLPSFRQGLRDLGYVEGQTIVLEYRFGEGGHRLLDELVAAAPGLCVLREAW